MIDQESIQRLSFHRQTDIRFHEIYLCCPLERIYRQWTPKESIRLLKTQLGYDMNVRDADFR